VKICGIYKIESPKKKVYIGQSIDIINRWKTYANIGCKNQTLLYNSLKKYGVKKHKFEVLCQCNKSELDNLEKYYIGLFQSYGTKYGLNLKQGGSAGVYLPCSDERKIKIGNANRGRIFTKEHKEKMRQAKLGRKISDETKLKMSIAKKGKLKSDETKKRMSLAFMGNKKKLGYKLSEETKQKMKIAQKKSAEARKKISIALIGNKNAIKKVNNL